MGSVISMHVSYLQDAMFVCFHVFVKWVVWYSGLLWLVIFAVVSRCDLMCRSHLDTTAKITNHNNPLYHTTHLTKT